MRVKLLDLPAQHAPLKKELLETMSRVTDSGVFIMGPELDALERELCSYTGAGHALGVSSGTDALLLALMALGVGPGDEVVTSTFSFFATAGTIARLGAKPVFVDIDPASFNLDVQKLEAKLTKKTKCLLPVHIYGQCADMDAVLALAKARGLSVVEDACQAIGAKLPNGRQAGAMGDAGCLSFFPTKNLGALGDAGAVLSNDEAFHAKMKRLRVHGAEPKYYHKEIGGNFRLDALQAALLRVKLRHLPEWTKARRRLAARYRDLFTQADLIRKGVILPVETWPMAADSHIYHQFVLRVPRRDDLREHLRAAEVESEVYYPVPLHLQECFKGLGYKKGDCPQAEKAAEESLALPIHPALTDEQLQFVVGQIADFLR